MKRAWLWGLSGLAALVVLSAGVAGFLLWRLDPAREIERRIEAATGREVTISGGVDLTFFPSLGVTAREVSLANWPGAETPHMLEAKEVRIAVAARPLLDRRLEVETLVLTEPKIALETESEGKANWVFPGLARQENQKSEMDLSEVRLGDVRIVDGALTYLDRSAGSRFALDDIEAKVSLESLSSPLTLDAGAMRNDTRLEARVTFAEARSLLSGQRTPLSAQISSTPLTARFDGALDGAGGALVGRVSARGADLRAALALFAAPPPPGPGLMDYSIEGDLAFGEGGARFTRTRFSMDGVTGEGAVAVAVVDKRVKVDGDLRLGAIDLNVYFKPASKAEAGAPPPVDVTQEGWSDARIDLAALRDFDLSLQIATGPVTFQNLSLDSTKGAVALGGGLMRVRLDQIGLYGGIGEGRIELDVRGEKLRLTQEMKLRRLATDRFLKDFVNFRSLEGLGEIDMRLATVGASQRELMGALDGDVRVGLVDGAFKGVNLGGVGRTIRVALSGEMVGPNARTSFKTFGGNFTIVKGVAATKDFLVDATDARVAARGLIDLSTQRLDMIVTPRADSVLRRLGVPGAGVSAPFRVSGPWAKPTYALDLTEARNEVTARVRTVEERAATRVQDAFGALLSGN